MRGSDDGSFRGWRYEEFEERLALSVQPVADFWYDRSAESIVEPSSAVAQPLGAAEGHGWNDLAAARAQYGLSGSGQTVVVIDSGIAYDHMALGGGLGRSYKVVGGWDFAENDANPYDDAPAGFHGTHVAGIVGSQDRRYAGVAPNVDLVALRVFDDQGGGNFDWVNQALAWVHQHRNEFEFAITTVNLSLGTEWNANTLPQWSTLESGLKQLADDGIFVTVAAGNSFQNYNTAGLSYPAVSPHVTPVASVDASGNLSRFSQRSDRVLAAPGERITSTLPDAFYGGDGIKNDFGAASGTSMAAPYVAGASVLVREAMQNLGFTQITQSSIYDLLQRTADSVYDAVTRTSYDRINVSRALSTLVGADDFGSAASSAGSVGRITTTLNVSGTIGSTSDQDFFQFVAGQSGRMTLTLSDANHLGARWQATAGGQASGDKLTLDVISGRTYVVGVAGGGTAIGKYNVDLRLSPTTSAPGFSPVNWGAVGQRTIDNVAISGSEKWFQATAGTTGRFTTEAFYAQGRGNVDIEIYDVQQRLLGASSGANGSERIDVNVAAGDTVFVRVVGANPEVDFRLTNLVMVNGAVATVSGTAGNDAIRWQGNGQLSINGVNYSLVGATQVSIDGRGGIDALVLSGGGAAETVTLGPGTASVASSTYQITASGCETIQFFGDRLDWATLFDSAADDVFEATPQWGRMSGGDFVGYVGGVGSVTGVSQAGGADMARLFDSAGNDSLAASPDSAALTGNRFASAARGFSSVEVVASAGGYDVATLQDSAGADQLYAGAKLTWLRGTGFSIRAEGFDAITVNATFGSGDFAVLVGSNGNDVLGTWWNNRNLFTGGVGIRTFNFENARFDGGGGYDSIDYYSSTKNSRLYAQAHYGTVVDQVFRTEFNGIESFEARVRPAHRLKAELAALEFAFQRWDSR